jgi:hypothetical protein
MKPLLNYTESNPLEVKDYPYGFRLRTSIFYWIETTPKKGDRFCSYTINPKNGRRNADKKSTYSNIGVMYQDEKGHTHWTGINIYSKPEQISKFIEMIGGVDKLNSEQKKMYNSLMGINEVKQDEFTGKVKKDFSIKWEREIIGNGWKDGVYNNGVPGKYREVKITFDRPDGVKPREIFEAMKSLNQEKLHQVFEIREDKHFVDHAGVVRICTRGGNYLGTVGEDEYKEYLASDANVTKEEMSDSQ